MIIRSQDKKCIVNLDNIDCIYYSNKENGIIVFNGEAKSHIGKYSTEEKSIKVLDMIEKQYASYSCRYGSDCSSYAVFQMPQDSEV